MLLFLWENHEKNLSCFIDCCAIGKLIAEGIKTLEIRSWRPNELPLKDISYC